jgi:hypothetical protein
VPNKDAERHFEEEAKKKSNAESVREVVRQKRKLSKATKTAFEWKSIAKQLERELDAAEARLDTMLALQDAGKPIEIRARKRSGKNEATAWVLAGDWHVEEEVLPETVNGLNEFNLAIADKRIERYYQNIARVMEINRHGAEIGTIVHPLLGDFFSGHIHEDLVEVAQLSPTQSVQWLVRRIEGGIRFLLDETDPKHLIIPCCIGNHSRTTARPRIATAQDHSLEWLMYHWLADRFEHEKQVQFKIASGYHLMVDCHEMLVRVHHGDWVRYHGGIGGLSIPLLKAIAQWDKAIRADLDVIAHWHQFCDYSKAIVNGSLIGWNAFASKIKASYEPPSQGYFLIDAEHRRKTMVTPIFLE